MVGGEGLMKVVMTCTNCASDDAAIAVTCAFVTSLALHISIAFESVKSGMDSSRSLVQLC